MGTKNYLAALGRVVITLIVLLIAIIAAALLWKHYMLSPWTRDGRVRAEIVNVASDVPGRVIALNVIDNQFIHKGDTLFTIEPQTYQLALDQAKATLESRKQQMILNQAEASRRSALGKQAVISGEEEQIAEINAAVAEAAYKQAIVAANNAKLNLDRTVIKSPVNGYITNLHLRVGDYAAEGQTKLTIVDSDSFWIAGYFEETKIPHIHKGDRANVELMGVHKIIRGHVEAISRGIVDQNGGAEGAGLANVDPVFTWVRLAQRIPVRIDIDKVPAGVRLVAGQTCSISISPKRKNRDDPRHR